MTFVAIIFKNKLESEDVMDFFFQISYRSLILLEHIPIALFVAILEQAVFIQYFLNENKIKLRKCK